MPIVAADIVKRLSVTTGAAGDATAGTPAGSLGKYVSTTAITDATLANLFDEVTGAEAAAGGTDYRCLFVLNNHATLTAQGMTVQLLSETAGGAAITLATDNIAASAKGSAAAQAALIAAEGTAPTGVSAFGAGPLTIGDVAPGLVRAVWVKRTWAASTAGINTDGGIIRFSFDTLQ